MVSTNQIEIPDQRDHNNTNPSSSSGPRRERERSASLMTYRSSEDYESEYQLPVWPKNIPNFTSGPCPSHLSPKCAFPMDELSEGFVEMEPQLPPCELTVLSAQCSALMTESGQKITFKEVIGRSPRTIVIFIRNFYCPWCQKYLKHISESLQKGSSAGNQLAASETSLVVIGMGDWEMIASYRSEFSILE